MESIHAVTELHACLLTRLHTYFPASVQELISLWIHPTTLCQPQGYQLGILLTFEAENVLAIDKNEWYCCYSTCMLTVCFSTLSWLCHSFHAESLGDPTLEVELEQDREARKVSTLFGPPCILVVKVKGMCCNLHIEGPWRTKLNCWLIPPII